MTPVVIVILAVVWAAVLVPPMLQNRSQARPADSISVFQTQLSTLQRRTVSAVGGTSLPLGSGGTVRPLSDAVTFRPVPLGQVDQARLARLDAQRRRRQVLVGLLGIAGFTLLLTLVVPALLPVHLLADALLAGYVGLLVRRRQLAQERATKVRYMNQAPARRRNPAAPVAARQAAHAARHAPAQLELRPAAAN